MSAPERRRVYQAVEIEHRKMLDRLSERRGVERVKRLYDRGVAELTARLRKEIRAGKGDSFTAHRQRIVLAMLRDGVHHLTRRMAGELGDVSRDAQVDGLGLLNESIVKLAKNFEGAEIVLPTEESARFAGVIDKRRSSLLRQHETSMRNYGTKLIGAMETDTAQGLLNGETNDQVISRIEKTAGNEWWQSERIVRTETAYALNATHADGLAAAAQELSDLEMRWCEHVSDATDEPLDNRVGEDSVILHGQVARPGSLFVMPPGADVGRSLAGGTWPFPPNRPNDRAVLAPWRPGWGIESWRLVNGRREDIA